MQQPTRVVVGGGLFGSYAALVLADLGHDVLLIEQDTDLLTRASYVNQARLHTGLHYPRSILTAMEALGHYRRFRDRFPSAVRDFEQIYAVAEHNSKTSGTAFEAFIRHLGLQTDEVDPSRWFHSGMVARAFRVEEPTFDAAELRKLMSIELASRPNVSMWTGHAVIGGKASSGHVTLHLNDGRTVEAGGVVLATYAGLNGLRSSLGLSELGLTFELAEVVIGNVGGPLEGVGFTIMDGPFWSLMPFGNTNEVTLTSVGLTPLRTGNRSATFDCQTRRPSCNPLHLADCTTCPVRPLSGTDHQIQQMSAFLKDARHFTPTRSLMTVKAVLSAAEVDDARPTIVLREPECPVWSVFSGKVSTLFDLDGELA